MFGWKVAFLYLGLGLSVAIVAGWAIGRLNMQAYPEDWVRDMPRTAAAVGEDRLSLGERLDSGFAAVREIVGTVWPYILAGIAIGAGMHGYVPADCMASFMGKDAWWAVPLAVVIGVPMYTNAAGAIPIVQALLAKGVAVKLQEVEDLREVKAYGIMSMPGAAQRACVLRKKNTLAKFTANIQASQACIGADWASNTSRGDKSNLRIGFARISQRRIHHRILTRAASGLRNKRTHDSIYLARRRVAGVVQSDYLKEHSHGHYRHQHKIATEPQGRARKARAALRRDHARGHGARPDRARCGGQALSRLSR